MQITSSTQLWRTFQSLFQLLCWKILPLSSAFTINHLFVEIWVVRTTVIVLFLGDQNNWWIVEPLISRVSNQRFHTQMTINWHNRSLIANICIFILVLCRIGQHNLIGGVIPRRINFDVEIIGDSLISSAHALLTLSFHWVVKFFVMFSYRGSHLLVSTWLNE